MKRPFNPDYTYQLAEDARTVWRLEDGASIPNDPGNFDWLEYENWLAQGRTPAPYVPPSGLEASPEFISRDEFDALVQRLLELEKANGAA